MGCCGKTSKNIITPKMAIKVSRPVIKPNALPIARQETKAAAKSEKTIKIASTIDIQTVSSSIIKHKCPVCKSKVRETGLASNGRKRGKCTNMTCQHIFYL